MQKKYDTGLMWFRRDLRVDDNAALYHALKSCRQVFCLFVLDKSILDALPRADRRVEFIRESLVDLTGQLQALGEAHGVTGVNLIVQHAEATSAVLAVATALGANAVFTNHDDEPQALARDAAVQAQLAARDMALHSFKDHVIFERQEVLTLGGKPYTVFTPYKNAWLKKVTSEPGTPYLKPYPTRRYGAALASPP